MKLPSRTRLSAGVAVIALMPALAQAASTVTWNTDNVDVGPAVASGDTGFSVIYQGPVGVAETNGRIAYTAPEANTPGLEVENAPFSAGGESYDGCIRASSSTTCDGAFRSGKRFKQQLTDTGPVDLVFDVENPGESTLLRSFHRVVNLTGQAIKSFTVELGTGVGSGFVASTLSDGLSFARNLGLGPNNLTAFSQFPFGLFGEADNNPNFTLDGFFDNARAGFDLDLGDDPGVELDVLSSSGMYGAYFDRFGFWMSQEVTPLGLLWDDDGNPDTDALVMSAFDEVSGQWETLRAIDGAGNPVSILDTPQFFDTAAEVASFLGIDVDDLEQGQIEDLANLNLNYGILLDDTFAGDSFTLRVTTAPVPIPPAAPLLAVGVGLIGLMRRRSAAAS